MNALATASSYNYIMLDAAQPVTAEQVITQLEQSLHPQGLLVIRQEYLSQTLQQLVEARGWHLLGVERRWRCKMKKYLNTQQSGPHNELILMAIFVTADTQKDWLSEIDSQPKVASICTSITPKIRPSTKRLLVCVQQPCSCLSRTKQQIKQIAQACEDRQVKLLRTQCIGGCSPLGSALYSDGESSTVVTDLLHYSKQQLNELFN
ncbi:hypothetical protein [Shewanella sp. TC10]|uniref:hypothetical protein n=1 Tax=Shewanella sp. TC10 TaxID=1419739 RepID=UPI00129DFEC2|nr:hypothetical protein [Shewanella sp. TC10]